MMPVEQREEPVDLPSAGGPSPGGASVVALLSLTALSACGGGGVKADEELPPVPAPSPTPTPAPTRPKGANPNDAILAEQLDELAALPEEDKVGPNEVPVRMPARSAVRFLSQASFGATVADIEPLRDQWRTGWLEQQFAMPVSRTHWDSVARYQADPNVGTIEGSWDQSVWEVYATSPDQLRRRAGYALSQILVVSVASLIGGGGDRSRNMAAHMDRLEKGAFGNFRDLLEDVTLSPAMGFYLTYMGNRKAEYDATGKPVRMPDENYAREVMQLFTIGTVELNLDGTPRLRDGKPVPTYQQDDIVNLARVFTGWTVPSAGSGPDAVERWRRPMVHDARWHSLEEKQFLGITIPAGTPGPQSLKIALDTLFNHPNVGPFIGRQLIQRMVTSNPSAAYVARVATRFNDDGNGVRGNMRAVFTQVLMDPEARSPRSIDKPSADWGKLREPVLRFLQVLRLLNARPVEPGVWGIRATQDEASSLGQSPGRAPTVFNFYEPDFSPPGTPISARQLLAPEFQIVDEVSVLGVVNFFANLLIDGPRGMKLQFDPFTEVADNPQELVRRTNLMLAHGSLSQGTRELMTAGLASLPQGASNALLRARWAVLMVLASPDYLIQK